MVKWRVPGIFSPDYTLNVRCVIRVVSYLLPWLFSLFWVQCAHAQLNPFYHPFYPDITHVRKDTRPSPTLSYWKRRKESWVGLGNKTSTQICSTGWEFLYYSITFVVAISFVQSNYMHHFTSPFIGFSRFLYMQWCLCTE